MIPLVWIPGHMCGDWLYAPQRGAWPGPQIVADVARDDTLGAMADRLLEKAPERFALAGLSLGGMVAMKVMVRAPGRVVGALLMDTDPTAAREQEIAWRAEEMADVAAKGPEGYVGRFVEKFYAHDADVAERLGPETRKRMAEAPVEVISAQARALDTRRTLTEHLGDFGAPVEVVVGAQDRVCPPRLHRILAEALPDAVLTEIPGCGHIATLEAPETVTSRLRALADRIAQ